MTSNQQRDSVTRTGMRDGAGARDELISQLGTSLRDPPETLTGVGKGRLVDVGPIILGHRLSTTKTFGAYQTLIHDKGALVLRMLHFLLSDPNSGQGEPFFQMMTDLGVVGEDDNEREVKTALVLQAASL